MTAARPSTMYPTKGDRTLKACPTVSQGETQTATRSKRNPGFERRLYLQALKGRHNKIASKQDGGRTR